MVFSYLRPYVLCYPTRIRYRKRFQDNQSRLNLPRWLRLRFAP